MTTSNPTPSADADPGNVCAEDNPWNPILPENVKLGESGIHHLEKVDPRKDDLILSLETLDVAENQRVDQEKKLIFHVLGCSGDPITAAPQDAVAGAIASQLALPDSASFLYHLGDIAYKPKEPESGAQVQSDKKELKIEQDRLISDEFYQAYPSYHREIVAVAGNHDGKYHQDKETGKVKLDKSPMFHFLINFCAKKRDRSPDDMDGSHRRTQNQPYPFWVLDTPVASLIGLYTNVLNGGQLDPPGTEKGPQYQWLVRTLKRLKDSKKPILVMLHYPPV